MPWHGTPLYESLKALPLKEEAATLSHSSTKWSLGKL